MTCSPPLVTTENGRPGARNPSCARGETPSARLSVTTVHRRTRSPSASARRKSALADTDSRSERTWSGSTTGTVPDGVSAPPATARATSGGEAGGRPVRCRSQVTARIAAATAAAARRTAGALLEGRSPVFGVSMPPFLRERSCLSAAVASCPHRGSARRLVVQLPGVGSALERRHVPRSLVDLEAAFDALHPAHLLHDVDEPLDLAAQDGTREHDAPALSAHLDRAGVARALAYLGSDALDEHAVVHLLVRVLELVRAALGALPHILRAPPRSGARLPRERRRPVSGARPARGPALRVEQQGRPRAHERAQQEHAEAAGARGLAIDRSEHGATSVPQTCAGRRSQAPRAEDMS